MEKVKLYTGYEMPVLGFGTWKSEQGKVGEAVKVAIDAGYRHIDCAYAYGNEAEVGEGMAAKIADGTVKREDLFVTTKLWNTFHKPDWVRKGFQESLDRLKLTYIDLFMMHWPVAMKEGGANTPRDEEGNILFTDDDFVVAYKEMEKLVDEGLVRSLGICNFNSTQFQRLLDECRIKPAMHQFEVHPYLSQQKLIDFTRERGILVTAYSPFGSPDRPWAVEGEMRLLDDPRVLEIAGRVSRTPAQVLLRYARQRDLSVLAKSTTPSRIKENLDIFNFKLEPKDMEMLKSMENGFRAVPVPHWMPSKFYPFTQEF